jgi:glutathione S-transferase
MFCAELHVEHSFRVVRDLMSCDSAEFGGNPALKLPTLETPRGAWFGTLSICRELSRLGGGARIVWPEDSGCAVLANAHELVMAGMLTEVSLIVSRPAGRGEEDAVQRKLRTSLVNSLEWLEHNARRALEMLPADRDLSYLEVALFCFVTHLEFRDVVPTAPYAQLKKFCGEFGTRPSAQKTEYRFDA